MDGNYSSFDHLLAEAYADSEAASAGVEFNGAQYGGRVVQHSDDAYGVFVCS